ncbi:hypothetical protein [Hymenobacter sp. BRD67]|uniref:hypothetical protein n=1 Tax=Hymenobacter sp. BRD67 TaxID=2675877 RepID=UPI0015677F45|nr:hypothetical protein [Hymenobacter sp. BRD67]QKG53095.1 hypothetical protein GKZ67_11415 [Hymenobacter sp. BRD67]
MRILAGNAFQLTQPPRISLNGQHDIGLVLPNDAEAAGGIAVVHQHVGYQQAEMIGIVGWTALTVFNLLAVPGRVGPHAGKLVKHGGSYSRQYIR